MKIRELDLPGVFEVSPKKIGDERGFFSETFSASAFGNAGLPTTWVQDNFSRSNPSHVLRGLHYQTPPFSQDKLVRVIRGSILDVVVDIREKSPHFGKWVSLVLSEAFWNQMFVPKGFAHGFLTLEPNTDIAYKVSEAYSPQHDRSIRWDDPQLMIDWKLQGVEPTLSPKDRNAPLLHEQKTGF